MLFAAICLFLCVISGNEINGKRFRVFAFLAEEGCMYDNNHFKEELLAAISELFLTFGLRSTSMDDISARLKISKKTLYQIFENKDDVVEQVALYRLEKRRHEIAPEELAKLSPVQFLCNIKTHILRDLNTQLPANYFDVKKYHPEVYVRIQREEMKFTESLMEVVLEKGIRDGFLREDADMKLQVYLLTRQFAYFKEQELANTVEYPMSVILSAMIDNFILSITTEKGRNEFEKIRKEDQNNG